VPSPPPIEQACYWLARRPPRDLTPLAGRRDADVAIVGAGLTGLWTALFLGHGPGTTRLRGRILAHLALGCRSELLDLALVRRRPLPSPPEPLRSRSVAGVTRELRRVDRGARAGWMLRVLERMGLGFSS
jgi:hypothetical protein